MEDRAIKRCHSLFIAVSLLLSALATTARAGGLQLHIFHSRHYTIHTNLDASETRPYAEHMDLVFDNYRQRFSSFQTTHTAPMQFYLLRTRRQYLQFLAANGINAANSGGMFFVTPDVHGLATWASGQSRLEAFSTLQHEGFHQFAYYYIGHDLPPWANEGIAQYFEDGIIVHGKLILGLADAHRLDIVQSAIKRRHIVPLGKLVNIDSQKWGEILQQHPQVSTLLYAEAWNMTYFLIRGGHGRYSKAFVKYLHYVANGMESRSAFKLAFGTTNFNAVERSWLHFAVNERPAPMSVIVSHLKFLGGAMQYLADHHQPIPRSVADLRSTLQNEGFEMIYRTDGINHTISAQNNALYTYPAPRGGSFNFQMIQPPNNRLPPAITAPGLHPQPTLTWSRNDRGELTLDIVYR